MTRHRRVRDVVVPHVAAALSCAALTAAAPIARMVCISWTMVLLALPRAAQPAATPTDSAYVTEIRTWHAQRLTRLQADTGYLALAGLFWLENGEHTLGSDAANAIVLPAHSAVIPGTAFGQGGGCSLRVPYGPPDADTMAEGMSRLVVGLRSIVGPVG